MNHAELVQRAAKWLRNTERCQVVYVEPPAWSAREIPDAIGFHLSGHSVVVECKTSRADFLADRRKPSRRLDGRGLPGMGYRRWYLIADPAIITDTDELRGWGVLQVHGKQIRRRTPAGLARSRTARGLDPETAMLVLMLHRGRKPWKQATKS